MKSPSIFLTGGTGFFGRSLLDYWINQYHIDSKSVPEVTILSRNPEKFISHYPRFCNLPWLKLHLGNILDQDTLPKQVGKFTHILHAATDSTLGPKLDKLHQYEQIVVGTKNILDFAVHAEASRFLLTSSGSVYGTQPLNLEKIPEDYLGMPNPLQANNTYGIAKRMAEHLCILYKEKYGLETVIGRCFTFSGSNLPIDSHFAIGNFVRDALWHDEIRILGSGKDFRSYLDQYDLASWLNQLLFKGQSGTAYNVGSDEAITIYNLALLIREIISPNKKINFDKNSRDTGVRRRYIPEIKKIQTELDMRITIPISESIKRMASKISNKDI